MTTEAIEAATATTEATPPATLTREAARRLRAETLGLKLDRSHLPTTKRLTAAQRKRVADEFGAEADVIGATKKLLNTRHPKYKAVTAAMGEIKRHWRENTTPYTEPGIRLIHRERIEEWDAGFERARRQLAQAVEELQAVYADELLPAARQKLAELFDEADYLGDLRGAWGATREYVTLEPPEYLQRLNPKLYQEASERLTARLQESVQRAEQAFEGELERMLTSLVERLTPAEDGKNRVLQQRGLDSLNEFCERYRQLQYATGSERLTALVETVRAAATGADAKTIRGDAQAGDRLREAATAALEQLTGTVQTQGRQIRLGPTRDGDATHGDDES